MSLPTRRILASPRVCQADLTVALTMIVGAFFASSAACALFAPWLFWLPSAAAGVAGIAVLIFRYTTVFCVAWLLIAGATLEMTLQDLVGPAAYQGTIAAVKGGEPMLALGWIL